MTNRPPRSSRKRRPEPEQLVLFKTRGGKRRGAGRPPKGKRAGSPHKERPFLHERYPVHVVLRVISAVGNLRRRRVYQAIREATLTTARRENFPIVHLSIQRNHLHLLVEADHKQALASGMQGFQISAAKHLNAAISKGKPGPRRRGTVFPDRYHAEIITSPRQARHALNYVLNNWHKHKEDRARNPPSALRLVSTWLEVTPRLARSSRCGPTRRVPSRSAPRKPENPRRSRACGRSDWRAPGIPRARCAAIKELWATTAQPRRAPAQRTRGCPQL